MMVRANKKPYFDQWKNIKKAYKNPEARNKLRSSIKSVVADIADSYDVDVSREVLVEAGLSRFDKALEKYYNRIKRRKDAGESTYNFSNYFAWWAQEDIEKHLGVHTPTPLWKKVLLKIRKTFRDVKTFILLHLKNKP